MPHPWLKKNPFMSMWLSATNAGAGSMRGQMIAQAKRQSAAVTTKVTNDILDAWTAGLARPPAKKRKRR